MPLNQGMKRGNLARTICSVRPATAETARGSLTRKCFQEHGELLPRHVELSRKLHERNDLGDDRIVVARHAPAKSDDGDYARCISLQVLDVLCRVFQEIEGHYFALVILDVSIAAYSLHAHADVHQLAVDAPVVAFLGVAHS